MNRVEKIEARLVYFRGDLETAKAQLERAEESFLEARRLRNNAKAKVEITAGRVEIVELELELELEGVFDD